MKLAGPTLAEQLLVSAVHIADMVMVGRIGPAAIAAVGLTNQPVMFLHSALMALNVGTTALVARLIGAGQQDRASAAAKQTLAVALILGVALASVAVAFAAPVLKAMGAGPDVMENGVAYFKVVGAGIAFGAMAMNMTASLRGAGDTKSAMKINIVANLFNVCGNYVLINGVLGFPRLGVLGAGVATTLARVLAFVMFLHVITSGKKIIRPDFTTRFVAEWDLLRRAFRVGVPAAVEQFVLRAGMLVFTAVVSGLGTVTFAAHQVGMNIMSISFMPGMAFSVAATTLVGQNLGAENPDEAERSAAETLKIGMMVGMTAASLFFFLGRQIAGFYSTDPGVIVQTASILKLYALVQPAQSTAFILSGALRGAGDTTWVLYANALGTWIGRVVIGSALVRSFGLGLLGAWIAMGVDQLGRSFLISSRFKSGRWKTQKV
jgi:putative MATE family efflux protein